MNYYATIRASYERVAPEPSAFQYRGCSPGICNRRSAVFYTRNSDSAGIRLNFDVPVDAGGHVLGKVTNGPGCTRYPNGPGIDGGGLMDYLDHWNTLISYSDVT